MQMGRTVEEAVREALADIAYHQDQTIGITVYAIDNKGGYFVGCTYDATHQPWYYVASGDDVTTTRYDSNDLYK